jgi:hypothetical protein
MEDIFLALLSAAAELLFEVFFQVVLETIVALIARSIRSVFTQPIAIDPILAAIGYLLLGISFGTVSLHFFPHPLVHTSRFHGISLMLSPAITGFVMSQVGVLLRLKGKRAVRIESFGYGFTFALGLAIIRFFFSR